MRKQRDGPIITLIAERKTKAFSGEDFIEKAPTEEEKRANLIKRVSLAKRRIGKLLDDNFDKGTFSFMAYRILSLYGYKEKEFKDTPISNAHKMAKALVCEDLLWSEFYNRDGTITNFAENLEVKLDPSDFEALPLDWSSTKDYLKQKLTENGWIDPDEYGGGVGVGTYEEVDIAAEYANVFGKESIIALPFKVSVGSTYVTIDHEDDFLEPYGGDEYNDRIIFLEKNRAGKQNQAKP